MATVRSLEACHDAVAEDQETICAIYQYRHAVSNETLYSIEHHYSEGSTLRSGYVSNPVCIWTPVVGWSLGYDDYTINSQGYAPESSTPPEAPKSKESTFKLTLQLESPEDVEKLRQLFMDGRLKELGVTDLEVVEEEDMYSDDMLGDDQ